MVFTTHQQCVLVAFQEMIEFILSILGFVGLLFAVIVIFNLMIIVHEWGHFLAARWRGLQIDKFQIWFGKPIWKKTINGVQYGLGTIPMGGFVALPQMAPMEVIEGSTGEKRELSAITPIDKIIVAFAGPLFSFLLAVFFSLIVWGVGKPEQVIDPVVGWVVPDSPAEKAGFKPGDKILKVNGKETDRFAGMIGSVTTEIVYSTGDKIDFLIERDGEKLNLQSGFEIEDTTALERKAFRKVGLAPKRKIQIGKLLENGPAARAGLMVDDIITHVDGEEVLCHPALHEKIANADSSVELTVLRGAEGNEVVVEVTPLKPIPDEYEEKDLGIGYAAVTNFRTVTVDPITQVTDAGTMVIRTIGGLFSPRSDVSLSHLSGFVGIGRVYYQLLSLLDPQIGLPMVLFFSVLLNVNLALLNLLPLPVLDGGHITLATAELLRGKPVHSKALEYVQAGFAIMLFAFMFFVTFHDVGDLVRDNKKPPPRVYPTDNGG
ncbi:MAG: RIP metalloprotease RseP [Verrucomicrobiota bacterium]